MTRTAPLLVVALALSATSCASIVSTSSWPVTFVAKEPTEFTVRDEAGVARATAKTPMTVILSSSDGYFDPMNYTVESPGCVRRLDARFNGWYAGNLLIGGLIGFLIVDPLTGAMWRLPETYEVAEPLAPSPEPAAAPSE